MSLLRALPRSAQVARRFASSSAAAPISVTSTRTNASAPVLANIEASWKNLPAEEQYEVYQQLEEIQKRDWKELTIDEKKAAYFVAFGPHGPRSPVNHAGNAMRVILGTTAAVLGAIAIVAAIRTQAPPPPKTMTREYQEMTNEYMKNQKTNPFSGIGSEGYKGKGFVTLP